MRSRTLLALLTPLALFATGCVALASPNAPADAATSSDVVLEPAADAPAPASAPDEAAGLSLVEVRESGQTGVAAFVCVYTPVVGDCEGAYAPVVESETWFSQDLDGTLRTVDLTMTWDATTPIGEELTLGLAVRRGDDWRWILVSGASPLRLHKTDLAIPPDAEVGIYVWTPCEGGVLVFTCTTDPQPFEIRGTLGVEG